MRAFVVVAGLLVAGDALAGDKGACRKARRTHTIDGWTKYVLDHPDGVCRDEATGELMILGIGRVANGLAGDPTKLALAIAQLGHMTDADFAQFRELMGPLAGLAGGGLGGLGGGGLGGLGGLGGGLGGLGSSESDMSSLFGGLGESGVDYGFGGLGEGVLGGVAGGEESIYVGFSVVSTAGGWNSDAFYTVLDDARYGMQECWAAKKLPMGSVSYDADFALASGKVTVKGAKMTYSSDSQPHPEAEECVRSELGKLSFPAEYTGSYTYRVDFY